MFHPIIVLLRNNLSLTRKAFQTFKAQDIEGGVDILAVNNASTDGTAEFLQTQRDVAQMYFNPQISVAEAWNRALTWVFRAGAEYALVVNNDVELHSSNYRLLVEHGGDVVTGVSTDDKSKLMEQPRPSGERHHPDFSNLLIRRHAWEHVGPFDERYYPAYFEDNDYHVRMHRKGIHAVCIDVPFYHYASGTLKNADLSEQRTICKGMERNKALFFQTYKCYPGTHEYEALFT